MVLVIQYLSIVGIISLIWNYTDDIIEGLCLVGTGASGNQDGPS